MKTFYSILKCATRPTVDEQVSIALFLKGDNKMFFRYSQNKLDVIKGLIPKEAFGLLRVNLKNIDNYISKKNNNEILGNTEEPFLEEKYFRYLSNYANNLITFSEPKKIEVSANEEIFDKLFSKFIFEAEEKGIEIEDVVLKTKNKLNPKIKTYVNIDIELREEHIPKLAIPTKVWFVGENKLKVTGETTDFNNKQAFHLENQLRSYIYLVDRIRAANNSGGKFFLVGNEPAKSLSENHKVWASIRKDVKYLEYISFGELDAISEYMVKHGVTPLVKS